MDFPREKNGRMAVPQFGGWDQASGTSYTVVFTKARADRKEQKNDVKRASFGNENELPATGKHSPHPPDDPIMRKKKILTYINCCIRP